MIPRRRIAITALPVLAIAVIIILLTNRDRSSGHLFASGTVEATEVDLGFAVPGRLDSLGVEEGDRVSAGQVLAVLDRGELEARLNQARAQTAALRARLDEMVQGFRTEEIAQTRASLRAAEQKVADATRDLERSRRLFEGGAISRQQLDDRETALALARAERDRINEQLKLQERGIRREKISAQRALVSQADATIKQIEAALDNTLIRSPLAGVVTVKHRDPGEIVPAGAPVVTVMNPGDRWVRIFIREDAIGAVTLGQPAVITADTYTGKTYHGRVTFIASEAEFTPRNVQTTEERVKLVYEVKVKITDDLAFELKPGIAADVTLEPGTGS